MLGVAGTVWGTCHRLAFLLRPAGPGAEVAIDGRGRVRLPAWRRAVAHATGGVLIGTRRSPAVVVVAPTSVFEGVGDLLVGDRP